MNFTLALRATLRRGLLALATGLAAFLVVGVAVTELASARIEFSLFVGLAVAGAVYLRKRTDRFAPPSVRSSR